MTDDITILKNYYESTDDFEVRMALQKLIGKLEYEIRKERHGNIRRNS